ncbi:DUF7146 domain-containing protein [Rubritepida flocculans]|uniref:DUF7146 domain-containing protein n=1 Tax=Rubritepida flocculans TaxID=182403 RepID=UPI00041E210D|nr:toprim domain-containing protein [Rubritepida flocculans]
MRRHLHSVSDISAMLAERIESLAAELFPAGRRHGHEWRVGSLAGEQGCSLGIRLREPRRGVWKDFAGGEGGDALDLVAAARFGGDLREALIWARHWLGLSDRAAGEGRAPPPPPPRAEAAREDEERRQSARALWHGGRLIAGTPAAAYIEGRGVGLADLGRAPGALRFRPDVWCAERRINAPAMLAAILREGKVVACHRTFLAPGPAGRWTKAPIKAAKKVLGPMKGGVIPLHRGRSGRPWAEAPEEDTLALCEGIEDGLTIALHMPEWRVAAYVAAGNLRDLALPERFRDIVLVRDRDGDNPAPQRAVEAASDRWLAEGRSVREVKPPEGFKDFNAWHMAQLAGAARAARRGA